ncbi:MAG TPA: A24 family peptidase [Candidatus Dormibacteraeota bacterium]|nr:A24 family peptidase [Candidatus Dormibacteraeota bacterium]
MSPLVVALAAIGGAWGVAADRFASRWPAHEDGSVRGLGWRTLVTALVGALAFAGLASRFSDPLELTVFGVVAIVLVLLLATDLDQRLLPDELTLPLVVFSLALVLLRLDPFVAPGDLPLAVVAAIAIPGALLALSVPFGAGAFGLGDVKLLVSVGILLGPQRAIGGLVAGVLLGGLVIAMLVVARRITLRSYVPFGPFLILGALWGILVLP